MDYRLPVLRKNRKKRFLLRFFLVMLVGGFGIFFLWHVADRREIISPLAKTTEDEYTQKHSLADVIEASLKGAKGSYGIVIKHLQTGERYMRNADMVFEPGSLYKLWVMAELFAQMSRGNITEDEELSEEIHSLNDKFHIATESAELKEGTITMKVSDALEQMVTVSHNYAALLLAAKVRLANVANFLASNGFASSQLGEPPRTTAADIALFFEKLYRHEIVNASSSERMLKLLKAQKLNNKIPRYLPPDIVIAHKTGELNAFSHDAGIVYTPKGDYIIVVLTESDDPIGAAESIARLSEAVYAYFQREN